MPTNGMTIDSLNIVSSLTAQDEVPVWDKEASGEHTRKITAQNMANSVKSLASLPNTTEMNAAIAQSTATLQGEIDTLNSRFTLLYIGTVTTDDNGILQLLGFYDVTQYTAVNVRSREISNCYFSNVMNAKSAIYGESVVAFSYTGTIKKNTTFKDVEILLFKYA